MGLCPSGALAVRQEASPTSSSRQYKGITQGPLRLRLHVLPTQLARPPGRASGTHCTQMLRALVPNTRATHVRGLAPSCVSVRSLLLAGGDLPRDQRRNLREGSGVVDCRTTSHRPLHDGRCYRRGFRLVRPGRIETQLALRGMCEHRRERRSMERFCVRRGWHVDPTARQRQACRIRSRIVYGCAAVSRISTGHP